MKLKIALTVTAMSLLTLGAATAGAPESPKPAKARSQCFWTHEVSNFASSDDRIVNLRVGVNDYYQLEMLGRCQDVDWTQSIGIVSRGSSSICTGLDAEIIAPTSIGPQRCAVKTVRKLTPEEVKALPRRARP